MGAHGFVPQPWGIKLIQGGGRIQEMPPGEMEIVQRRANARVAQEPLDGVRVIARFEEVGRKSVPQRMDSAGLGDPGCGLGVLKEAPGRHACDGERSV